MSELPLPNFDALDEWIAKLRAWATEIHEEWEADQETLAKYHEENESLTLALRDQRNAEEDLGELREKLLDVDRGLITLDAVLREIRIDQAYR